MGNYLGVKPENVAVMAVTESTFGMQHPTVVPTNFEPTDEESVDEEMAGNEPSGTDSE
jgi:hypothetical protein